MRKIELKEAKVQHSPVIGDAVRGKPSVMTRHGKRGAPFKGQRRSGARM
jgi:hypothetical protein